MKPREVFRTGERVVTEGRNPPRMRSDAREALVATPRDRHLHFRGDPSRTDGKHGVTAPVRPKSAPLAGHSEIEAKYVVPDAATFEKLRSLAALGEYHLVGGGERRITDHYLDTPRRALLHGGYSCRRRADDAGRPEVVTVKGLGRAQEAVHHRAEHEAEVPPGTPPDRWPAGPGRDIVMRLAGDEPLVELVRVGQRRLTREVEREGQRIAVLSLDRVEFGPPALPAAYELEIELAPSGDTTDLRAIADRLQPFGLRPQALSKLERALALLDASESWTPDSAVERAALPPPHPPEPGAKTGKAKARASRRASGTGVSANEPMSEAGRKILRFHWEEALAREAGTIAGEDPEELHRMRVATRRQRAALRIVGPHFRRKEIRPVRDGLRTLGGFLGAVRDLDVLLVAAREYQSTRAQAEARAFQGLLEAWTRRDRDARRQMLAHLRGPDYTSFKEEYTRFLDTSGAGARTPADDEHPRATRVAHVLPSEIWAHYGAVCAYESLLPGAPVASLHALRIEGKRLRYLLEFFRDVLDRRADKAIESMVALQDHLGELQDAVVTMGLVREFLSGPDALATPGAPAAAARYLESRQARVDELRRGLDRPWSRVAGPAFRACLSRAVAAL
ncbi:MAG: CHAD domain-containing protein, partial [Candidatus Eisenbacteria bacterium]